MRQSRLKRDSIGNLCRKKERRKQAIFFSFQFQEQPKNNSLNDTNNCLQGTISSSRTLFFIFFFTHSLLYCFSAETKQNKTQNIRIQQYDKFINVRHFVGFLFYFELFFFSLIESGTQKTTFAYTCYLNMLLAVNCSPISEIMESLVMEQVSF